MTREEAIKYLNEFIFFKKISNTTEREAVECFKLAVEALQEHQHYKDLAESYEKTINKLTKAIQEQQGERTKERTETHACDCISRKSMLEGLANIAKAKAKSDVQKALMGRIMFFTEHLPSVTPQPKTDKALNLLAEWAIECGFGYDNIPEEYEKYKDDIEDMGYREGLVYIVKMESEAKE